MQYTPILSRILLASSLCCSFSSIASDIEPATLQPSQTDFGGSGLIQMPSARMAEEGNFNFGVSINDDYQHYYISLQLMPWLETTARYTRVPDMLFSSNESYSGDNLYTDKGFDAKVRLWQESYWLPETSIGLRDIAGTGLFDGEYIVTTKGYGPFDFTLGMGWGYLGQSGNISNPLCEYNDKYCTRSNETKDEGGSVDAERWFKGPAALFGGIEYQTPHQPLRLKLEYDGNDYSQDFPVVRAGKEMTQETHFNIGALYQWGLADLKVSWERGNTFTVGIDLATNFNTLRSPLRDQKKKELLPEDQVNTTPDWDKVSSEITANAGYKQATISIQGDALVLEGEQVKYRDKKEAQTRAAAILANNKPENINTYRIIEQTKGLDITQTHIDADKYRAAATHTYIGADTSDAMQESIPQTTHYDSKTLASNYSPWNVGISPVLTQSVGGAESFYLYNVGFNTNASYRLTSQLEVSGSVYFNIYDNYDKYNFVEENPHIDNFSVPRVRTMFRAYVHDNPIRLSTLQMTWFAQPSDNIYTQTYGGYLETMFAGVGSEVLYRPMGSNWALGLDYNFISQRDPDSWFDTYDSDYYYYDGYNSSNCSADNVSCQAYVLDKGTTGMLTAYYTPQWSWIKDTLFQVSAGKFLGGDKGVRVNASKQFKSGVIVGAYITKTDLTAEEYGEGSYNKGFYVSIPFDVLTVKPTTSRGTIGWQPITRDGGQTLARKYSLYGVTDSRNPWFKRRNDVE